MDSRGERSLSETVNFDGKIRWDPIFGPDAPPPVIFDPKDIKKSIYQEGNKKPEYFTREIAQSHAERDIRLRHIQGWFYRCSWSEKFRFISEVVELTSGIFVLEQILKCIDAIYSKDVLDSYARDRTKFIYDIVPTDDNRAVPPVELKVSKQEDELWFLHCDTATQIEVILKLLKLGGGGLIFNAYKVIDKTYRERKVINMVLTAVDISIRELAEESAQIEGEAEPTENKPEQPQEVPDQYTALKLEQLSRRNAELHQFKLKYGLTNGSDKSKKKEPLEVVDYIQVLPLWVNRKIMLYMKEKDLIELKKTGRYWSGMIDDALRESSGRAVINAKIRRIEGGPAESAEGSEAEVSAASSALEVAAWGPESLLHVLGLKSSDVVRIGQQNEAFKWRRLDVHIWDGSFFNRRCCSVNRTCKLLAASTPHKAVHFYSLRTGARTGFPVITSLPSAVTSMAIHDEGFHTVIGCEDGALFCMNMRKNERTISYQGHGGPVTRVHISVDKLISASEDRTIKHFDLWSGLCLLCIEIDGSITSTVVGTGDGGVRRVIAGTAEGKLVFIDLGKKRISTEVPVHDKEVGHMIEEDNTLLTGGSDRTIRLWSLQHLESLDRRCELKPLMVAALTCAPTAVDCLGYQIFAACADGRLRVICKLSGTAIRVIEVTQKEPIMGIYVMQEKDTTKMIMWHESGIEMRSVSLGKFSDGKKAGEKKRKDTRPKTELLHPERKTFNVIPRHSIRSSITKPWRVKRYKGTCLEDREMVVQDMSCTAPEVRGSTGMSRGSRKDLFAEMLMIDELAPTKDKLMTMSGLTYKIVSSRFSSLDASDAE